MTRRAAIRFVAIALLLGIVAFIARGPLSDDRDMYRKIGQQVVVLDCHDVHCFRVLLAVVIEHLPGPSLLKWKTYAVLTNAAAALALGRFCLVLGLSARAAVFATWIAAFGFGPLQAIFDPYTSDPLMYLLGPLMMADLLEGRLVRPGLLGSIVVMAKEFAAAPLWIFTLFSGLQRRWDVAARAALAALTATLVWLALQTWLMTVYNYSYGPNPSVDLFGGGYVAAWVRAVGGWWAAAYLFMAFGPVFVLMAFGYRLAGRTLRLLAISSLPAAAAFAYVQQPDRALWNFQFIVIPMAVLVLEALPNWMCWAFVVSFAVANLRLGPDQPWLLPPVRAAMLAASLALAAAAVAAARKRDGAAAKRAGLASR